MRDLPNSLPGDGRSLNFPLGTGDDLDGAMIRELVTGGDYVQVALADGRRGKYRLDILAGGVPRWVLEL
ncbi:hypothetical protein FM103_02380 [Corynebacterium xerosis]|nr:hypothetical protein FM103_02380 [Corynebacterium xerosis]